MKKRRPWNGPLEVWHALSYIVTALANFCVLELFWILVSVLIFHANSGQNPWAIFWRIRLIYNLDQYHSLQNTVVAFVTHAWERCNKNVRKETLWGLA